MSNEHILIEGARQNNLKGLNLRLPLHELIVMTGVSGSGKSSLAFETIYAEGQRRYVETFSPYARQFLDRMDKPHVDRIDGIPPAIAIDQTNPVRTSRSTVGTMTELNDHLKLLFARAAALYCRGCGAPVRRDTPQTTYAELRRRVDALGGEAPSALITFTVTIPKNFSPTEIKDLLTRQGYTRMQRKGDAFEVTQDRVRLGAENRERVIEDLEAALKHGRGSVKVQLLNTHGEASHTWPFSSDLRCPDCDIHYRDPLPSLFSFNLPIGACDTCRGFGRTIGVDYALVIPDESRTLAEGAVRPWQTQSYRECQDDLLRFARKRAVPTDVPWRRLSATHKRWVLEGEGEWEDGVWYGVSRFFRWLESRSYKMHIRVLLSKYRAYTLCPTCNGARLKPEALAWRLGSRTDVERAPAGDTRFRRAGVSSSAGGWDAPPGLTIHDVMLLPIERACAFFDMLELPAPLDEATVLLLGEIRTRLRYLLEVGLGYLTLDRQSRTLSGGEVQRINLTTALGTSLVNTLFVLDEPSIGLHARDIQRVVAVLQRLRDAGNSLVVVEHDPQVMLAADRIVDLGPGPGERGGEVVFFGTPQELLRAQRSLTASYLTGAKTVVRPADTPARAPDDATRWLQILGAAEHNLKEIDVSIPLNRLVCITGVSGSGKSTLVQNICYPALATLKGKAGQTAGRHRAIRGHEHLADVVLVDQSPIGKTTRSNPASYVGALDALRKLFAAEPLARERGYSAGTFSFNAGNGRCPTCGGNGFEHVEMQFLSDVYLRCPDCDGKRYRPEVLEVKLLAAAGARLANSAPRSMADVLDMTVAEALEFFSDRADVLGALAPLAAVGLHYMKLGQPVPTLSGGEAQRLKLAGHLAEAGARKRARSSTLFLFDEPTTGLHFHDTAILLQAFGQLLAQGHSVVVIEHNLDVVRAADWIIDLGPEGGGGGGRLVYAGTPEEAVRCEQSHTGRALQRYRLSLQTMAGAVAADSSSTSVVPARLPRKGRAIRIHNAREHNLRNIDVHIPRDRFTVITGVSGSGKSTLAFDILFAEGQRRYLESLNAYARQFVQPAAKPDVDAIFGIPPTVAIEQRTSRGGRKSTVATLTEIYHFLRLLFVKLGTQHCPDCRIPIEAQTREAILAKIMRAYRGRTIGLLAPLVVARKGYYTDLAKWAAGKGFSHLRVDGALTPTASWPRLSRFREHNIELPVGELKVAPKTEAELRDLLTHALEFGKGAAQVVIPPPLAGGGRGEGRLFSTRRACPRCGRSFEELDPRLFSFNSKHGWCERCYGTGLQLPGFDADQTGEEIWWNEWWEGEEQACVACQGSRLRPEALAVRFRERSISELTRLSVAEAEKFFRALRLRGREAQIARDILAELRTRLAFLRQVGLDYLQLERAAPSLSGGEAQRIRLVSQLGSNLRGVCYILDEPTIGLHARDNQMLLDTLQKLQHKGNTVVVVEHDEETIRRAEHVVDLGPGAGVHGGRVVAAGPLRTLLRYPDSVTGRMLAHPLRHPLTPRRPVPHGSSDALKIVGASLHNLKNLDVGFPLGRLVCVTGVSGSGKSTLVREVLHDNLRLLLRQRRRRRSSKAADALRGCTAVSGWERIDRVLEVDQTPIGKTPRSCPATYVGVWDHIRRLFAGTAEARMRGYGAARFSFNVPGGRCQACEGHGIKKIEMSFLPNVKMTCEVCGGSRFTVDTLAVHFKGRNIGEVLAMSMDEAAGFFAAHAPIYRTLRLLQDVGLGYLTLGQQSPTLSGGEAQRIKLIAELTKTRSDGASNTHSLYVLDEPTIGLHMADVEKLILVLHRLVTAGNTVVIIEHNLDVIAEADWIIDLGPEGGDRGGRSVATGAPETVARVKRGSYTANILRRFLAQRAPAPVQRAANGRLRAALRRA